MDHRRHAVLFDQLAQPRQPCVIREPTDASRRAPDARGAPAGHHGKDNTHAVPPCQFHDAAHIPCHIDRNVRSKRLKGVSEISHQMGWRSGHGSTANGWELHGQT